MGRAASSISTDEIRRSIRFNRQLFGVPFIIHSSAALSAAISVEAKPFFPHPERPDIVDSSMAATSRIGNIFRFIVQNHLSVGVLYYKA
jgi:hypothetical protein